MRQAFSLMIICATALLASCTADDLDRGFEEIGAGVIVTQDSGDGTVAFYWVDPSDKTQLRYRYAVANPPSVSGAPYGTRISPDLLGEFTLIFDGVPNEAPQIHLLRTRDGFAQARLNRHIQQRTRRSSRHKDRSMGMRWSVLHFDINLA